MSTQAFLNRIKAGALLGWSRHKILPSITGAQGVLEGASGTSRLAQPPYNNQFGIKAGAGWSGRTVTMPTQEWVGGQYVTVNAEFRAYDSIDESVADHAAFFTNTEWRKNNYRHVVGEKDYKVAARALQSAGYATDPEYANKLIRIVEQYGLQKWDDEAFGGQAIPVPEETVEIPSSEQMVTSAQETDVFQRHNIERLEYKDDTLFSPKGESVIYNPSLNDQFGFQTRTGDVLWIDHVLNVNSDDENEILEEGLAYMRQNAQPNAQYRVKLKRMPEDLSIGDTGMFIDHEFEPPLYIKARILEINESFSNPDDGSVVVGNVKEVKSQTDAKIFELQHKLQATRDELKHDFFFGGKIEMNITSTKGSSITTNGLIKARELIKEQRTLTEIKAGVPLELEIDTPSVNGVEQFMFSGKVKDNLIEVAVSDEVVVEEIADVPTDISDGYQDTELLVPNPQGEPTAIFDEVQDAHEILLQEFTVEFIDLLGTVKHTEKVAIMSDSTFNQGILRPNVTIKYIRITSPLDVTIENISFKEPERVNEKSDVTELIGRITQNERDITERYDKFMWTRISDDDNEDLIWNDKQKFNNTPRIAVTPSDVYGLASTFVLTAIDDDGYPELGGHFTVAIVREFDAYELAVNNGFVGTKFEWVESLKTTDTGKGVPIKTENNELAYLHTAWADAIDGRGFSLEYYDGAKYMGSYISTQEDDSTDHSDYTWIRVQGQDGKSALDIWKEETNQPDATAEDFIEDIKAEPSYMHVAYAEDENGKGFSPDVSTGKSWIGFMTSTEQEKSQNPQDYDWVQLTDDEAMAQIGDLQVYIQQQTVRLQGLSTDLEVTKDNALITHSAEYIRTIEVLNQEIDAIKPQLVHAESTREQIETFFKFSDALEIRKSNSDYKLRIDNESIKFMEGETVGAYMTGDTMVTKNIAVENNISFGNHTIEKSGNKTVFRYVH